jgi:putative cell wall-binding protein/transglutaminase-like putative cysteine protease
MEMNVVNIKNLFASAGLISLVIITALITDSAKVSASSITRVGGENRYTTASQVAKTNWTNGSENVVLVSGEGYADSVSASVLAKKLGAPILLTQSASFSADAKSALETLKPKNVYVIGGTASISSSIESALKLDYNVTRLGGNDRYATNLAVANKLVDLGVSKDNIIVVAGTGFSDALSVAPVAAAKGQILLLATNDQAKTQPVIDFVKKNNSKTTVVGTKNIINDTIYNALGASSRVDGGADRFATNIRVLNNFENDLKNDKLYIANASKATPDNLYADALVASAVAGKYSAPLVLTDTADSDATKNAVDYIGTKATKDTDLQVVGGTGVVPQSVEDKINSLFENNKDSNSNDNDDNDSSDSSDKSSNKLTNATNAVVKAENSKLQADVDSAKALVDALEGSSDKTSLLNRLQTVQDEINQANAGKEALDKATAAVTKAESSKLQADVSSAKILVDALEDGSDKTSLINRLKVVQNEIDQLISQGQEQELKDAISAVSKAESSKLQDDVNFAKTLVDALSDEDTKTSLENRLEIVQNEINQINNQQQALTKANDAISKAESSKSQVDVDSAKALIMALPDSTDKTSLQNRLNVVQNVIDATSAVQEAEQNNGNYAPYNTAKKLVDALPSSSDKTSLENRLNTVDIIIKSKEYLATAQSTLIQEDLDKAIQEIDKLDDNVIRDGLLEQAEDIQNQIDTMDDEQKLQQATDAVTHVESTMTQEDYTTAITLVTALPDSPDKNGLLSRLDEVQYEISQISINKQKLDTATAAVIEAENFKVQADVDNAKSLVAVLKDSTDKEALQARLQAVQDEINQAGTGQEALDTATQAVVKAESTEFKVDVDSAKALVTALPDNGDKTSLLNRLQVIQPILTTHQEFYDTIKNSLQNFDESLDIYVDEDDAYESSDKYYFLTTIDEIKRDNPDLNAELLRYSYPTSSLPKITQLNGITKYKLNITFNYTGTNENMISKRETVASKVNEIVNSVTNATMTDYQKELALHDYLVNNCHYNYDVAEGIDVKKENNPDIYTAYGVLINGDAVCEGYADAMYRLLKAVGIDSMMVVGTVSSDGGVSYGDHAWNIVKIGGQYYQLDPTWDDPTYFSGPNEPIPGYNDPTHDYFNVTDDFLSQNHTWDKSQYPICNSTEYAYQE